MNSKALRILLTYGGQSAQIEINVEKGCPSIPMSSALLSASHGRPTRILRIMEPSVSFAHKIAAWTERELMRDLYDMYQYESIFRVKPQMDILKARLAKARSYANVIAARDLNGLIGKMTERANRLDEDSLTELRPILSNDELAGLTFRLRASILALCEKLSLVQ